MYISKNLAATNHAVERIKERCNLKHDHDVINIVKKAFISKKPIDAQFEKSNQNMCNQGYTTYFYRQYYNWIFCFQKKTNDIVLITVLDICSRNDDGSGFKEIYDHKNTKRFKGKNNPKSAKRFRYDRL